MTLAPLALWHPRYWLLWLGLALAWLVAQLPLTWLWCLGHGLGWLFFKLAHTRRYYTERNIALCFPEKNDHQQQALVKEHFAQLGMGLIEMLVVWFGRADALTSRCDVTGVEHLQQATSDKKGTIVCVFHTVHMEAMGLLVGQLAPIHPVYRPHENPLLEWFMSRNRSRHTAGAISNRQIKVILSSLLQGQLVWLSPDQRNRGDGIVVPFFGHDTLTHPSIARIARLTKAQIIPLFCRLNSAGRFEIEILPPLTDFPGDDDAAALTRLMHLLEADIAKAPAQYLWAHNRFNLEKPI
jgi:Kdo2-lipid IVA lauroyltransferase/acyltransferase